MKALVLLSGGLDSSTCLALAVQEYGKENVLALSLYYGQKHEREIQAAQSIVSHYGVEWRRIDVAELFEGADCTLLKGNADVPAQSYSEQIAEAGGKPVSTYVPFRNGLFISIATSVALSNKCGVIYYGAHKDDAAGNAYPDCSEAFHDAMAKAVEQGSGECVVLRDPFIDKTKSDIVRIGLSIGVPYEKTWSCYNGGEKPCRKCGTCRDREKAFALNGQRDPLLKEQP